MVHVPVAVMVTVLALTVQTAVVSDENVTVSADDVVALTVNGAAPYILPASAPNVIV